MKLWQQPISEGGEEYSFCKQAINATFQWQIWMKQIILFNIIYMDSLFCDAFHIETKLRDD